MSPAPDERDRIRAAMECILTDTPRHSNAALTIVALAQEAELPSSALTQRHLYLKNEFYECLRQRGVTPDVENRLRATIAKLKTTIANKSAELDQLRADVSALVRVINQLSMENQQLREALACPDPNVISFQTVEGDWQGNGRMMGRAGPSTSGAAIRHRVGPQGEIGVQVPSALVAYSFNWQDAPPLRPVTGSLIR
ncbi:cell division protein ZapB [[Kitasatospora] papulosa]|uniref:cell division protein ZapB n=1 Tax=Streptomyces sp. NPDC004981 TaxID=3156655 RepID=UPI0033BA5A19